MTRWRRPLVILGLLGLLGWIGSGIMVSWYATRRHVDSAPSRAWSLPGTERLSLSTEDGETLEALLLIPPTPRCVALLLHGKTGSGSQWEGVAQSLFAENVAAFAPSFRSHGGSTGKRYDFGRQERLDVIASILTIKKRLPEIPLVIVGQSLGSIAAIFASVEFESRGITVDGFVLESPYRDLRSALRHRLEARLPGLLVPLAMTSIELSAPLFLNQELESYSVYEAVDTFPRAPVTWIAGENDRLARPEDIRAISERCPQTRQFVLILGANHRTIQSVNPEEYFDTIRQHIDSLVREPG